ncbi:hypothetical protein GOP47_0019291 [Adiantum capillus-veneris]|uniref:Uncharacterized protein n=1 Tax=Adiantum capillus-veneris TaxID=13818 RepID=A0A9D4ZAD2_ADICA|nr:hypothetical protein GOP47_0019291 [Adiantum capillus-veneris]
MEAHASESNMGFARRLASPKKKTREKAISLLVLWLTSQKQLEEDELKKVWKGLFYCVWHSDKAPVQADLIERLASILEKLDDGLALKFFKVFLITMRREWAGIDRLRLDKFYLLLRKYLAHMFSALQTSGWDADSTKEFMDILLENAFLAKDQYAALGINLHYADIFLQELKTVLPLRAEIFKLLLEPFLVICSHSSEKSLLQRIKENIFNHLFNLSRMVITAKQEGHPIDVVEDVLGSLLLSAPFGPEAFKLASLPSTSQANRKILYELHGEFEKLEKLLETSGIALSLLTDVKKKKKKKKKETGLVPVHSIAKGTKKEARSKKIAASSKEKVLDRGRGSKGSSSKHISVFKECKAPSESKEGERSMKADKRKGSECIEPRDSSTLERKDHETTGNEEEKRRRSVKRKMVALVGTGTSEEGLRSISNGLGMDDSVVSKLEKQFDMLADAASVVDLSPNIKMSKVVSPQSTGKRKRKIPTSSDSAAEGHETLALPVSAGGQYTTPTVVTSGKSSGKVKRVRFALKKNLVWTPSTPLPAENVRVPPSATPRGSALKKGVPPGPIISETAGTLKQRKGTPKWSSTHGKSRKCMVNYVKLLCEQELAKGDLSTFLGGLLK